MIAYIKLTRPANIVTALADIFAGFAISGALVHVFANMNLLCHLIFLLFSTIGLYGGGVVFNDIADAELDAIERPERPIPSGRVSKRNATVLAVALYILALIFAGLASLTSFFIASFIIFASLVYDFYGKNQSWGHINMGLCRSANLLLGMLFNMQFWYLIFLPLVYISAITLISRGEVRGNKQTRYYIALLYYVIVVISLSYIAWSYASKHWYVWILILFFGFQIFSTLWVAMKSNAQDQIMKAVKTGVLSLILMNACHVAIWAGWEWALVCVALLPISVFLAKKFAVT